MQFASLVEIISAIHLSRYVVSPYQSRGGLMLVAPAGQLKTTAIEILDHYNDAKILSDLNVQSLIKLRDDIVSGDVQTLAFTDLEKLYKRHSAVASNVEGILMALVEEGFRKASFHDQRMVAVPARCAVVGAMTIAFYENNVSSWADSGFARRFLFVHYRLANAWKLEQSIQAWRKHELHNNFTARVPAERQIPYNVTPNDNKTIDNALKHQRSRLTPRICLQKATSVLRWKFAATPKRATDVLQDFAESLGPDGGVITL